MFTGIVQNVGILKTIRPVKTGVKLFIQSNLRAKDLQKGTSVAVNGVCLTVESKIDKIFSVSLVPETLTRTNFSHLRVNDELNLEPSLRLGDALAGHFVLGHVDFTAKVLYPAPNLQIEIPRKFLRFFPEKGSITINGVSLTIAKRNQKILTIALIPTTLRETNLEKLKQNDLVNVEIDALARYVDALK